MATWSEVEFVASEDTGCLDSVSREDNGSSLYQVDTLVKISTANEAQANPRLSSFSGANWSIIIADKTVALFDQSFQTILLLLHFETDVDAIDVCRERQFLVVCERNGNIHLFYVPYKRNLFTKNLVGEPCRGDKKTYCSLIIDEDKASAGVYHMFLLTNNGFFHIANLDLARTETAFENKDVGALKELQSLIKIDFCSMEDGTCSTAVMFNLGHEIHLMIGGGEENVLTHWKMDPHQSKMCLADTIDNTLIPGVKKMVVADNRLYVLDTEDVLSLWDLHFLVMIHYWPDLVIHDFELTAECGSASTVVQDKDSMKMITLTKPDQNQTSSLQFRFLPSMTAYYSLNVSSVSCLVETKINVDTIYLVEGVYENTKSCGEPINSVMVRCFTEALPENRLSRLLHKHMFEEAEKFAITFELDLELVYKVKLDFVLEQLASASVGGYGQDIWSELVDEAKTNLMKITDEQYVVDYCLKAPWPTFETAVKMLNHAASRYSCSQIHEAMARLDTFYSLHGSEQFNGIAWIEFLNNTDTFGDILSHLRDGDMKGAQLLWLRSEGQIAAEFDESKLEALLSAIPQDLPSQQLSPWFKTVFVPFLRRVLPGGQKILAKWLEQKARNLELTEKGAWPQNGLDLATLGLPSLWTWLKSDDADGAEEVENLKSLVSNLWKLLNLQQKYKCKLSLSVFEKRTVWSVAFFMLDKVPAPELIAATVENCIIPYTEEHNISLDELLLQYIKDLLERCSSQTTTLFTEWEAKAVAVHSCMTDTDLMVDAVLAIMQKAVVPWSKVVENLVQQYLEMNGPKQELLYESYHLMEIRKLLNGYGIRNFNLSTSSQIMTLIRYILKQDLQTSLKDALTLAKGYKLPTSQIIYLYVIQLAGQGKIEEILTTLKRLSSAEAECVIERLTTWARLQLEDKDHISEEHKKHQMVISQVMVEVLKYLQIIQKHDTLKSMACENNLAMFKAIAHLQEDFDVFFTPSKYEDPAIRKQIQEHHITAYENTRGRRSSSDKSAKSPVVANDPDGKTKTISTEAGLRRLGRQLQRTEQELWSDLALRALEAGKVDKALKILSELYEHHCNSSTGKVLFNAAKMLCQMLEADVPMVLPEGMDLPAVIHDLACQSITVCDSDLLLDCLELCKCTRIAMDVYHQCQLSDNYGFVAKDFNMTEKDSYSQWSFQDVFNEDCIVLDPVSVLPIQYEITNCLLPVSHDTKLFPLDCSCLSHHSFLNGSNRLQPLVSPLTNMLRILQDCTQLELAMRVLVNSYGSCLQHVTSNVMNMKLSVKLHDPQALKKYNACLNELRKTCIAFLSAEAVALLNKVFNWRVVDCDLAIGLCTLLPKAEVFKILWKVIDNTWQNYDKILAVAKVGADLCCLFNEAEEQKKFRSVITDAEWGIKLGKLEISIQPVFRQRPELKSSLIPDMVKNVKVTADIVLQYCSTFGLDRDNVINQYITTLLLLQEDDDGAGDLGPGPEAGPPLCHSDALERVLQIIPMLQDTSELTNSLCTSIFKLSPYNYERIEVVLTILQAADENVTSFSVCQAAALLQHLKSYTRVSPPSDVENSYLFENGLLPNPLSKSRLPFHLLIQTKHFWKIIAPELTEETFPTLLLITKLMKMNHDKLYMSAANHVFEKKMKPLLFQQRGKAQSHGYNKDTLKVAKTMMQFINCIQNPEFAAATAYSITQELPPGFEKTQYLRSCLVLGEAWLKDPKLEEESRAKAESFLSKLKLQFQRSATENALIANQLNSPEHQKLTGHPTRLIAALCEHSSVEQRFKETGGQTYPDIHAAVKEIAAINSVDLMKICYTMLEKWICKTGPAVAKEIGNPDCVDNIEDDPDLMRVVYMLQSCPVDVAVRLLIPILSAETWPLRSSGPRLTFCHRTRVLLCLIRLADAASLEAQLQIQASDIQYHVKCYIFVSQLEALNIPYTVRSFLSSPKEGLVKGLWKNHSHEPQAVRLVADLCLEYKVYDPQLLNSLLQRLLSFNLISHLQKVLETIVAVPALWEMSSLGKAWRTLTVGSLIKVCLPLDSCELENLYRSFVLLTKCPFLLSLDLRGIASDYEKVELYAFALGALCFISCVKTREREIKAFMSANNPVTVLDQVEEHMETGQLAGIPSKVRDSALDFICRQGLQSTLLNTRHFTHLREFVVSSGNDELLKDLVDSLISDNRQDDADEVELKFKGLQRIKKEKC
ncbi:kinetochore-associated protein 1 [Salarias fasciatus]|uniref:kinetochore-associated protein 1 n=1 Tax=Salarias fasciatus TaxID=181472 RepID=UPI00117705A2|nr:kinetochore-associated protein 1 [Salarias fasciatus]